MDALYVCKLNLWRKKFKAITEGCCEQYWTGSGGNIPKYRSILPPTAKTIEVRRTRNAGHCWSSKDELLSDILQLTLSHRRAKATRTARNYVQHSCADAGYSLEDLPGAMDDRDWWQDNVREIHAGSTKW